MTGQPGLTVREVTAEDDAAALALERCCPQGGAFRIVFARNTFRRRTESFAKALLLGAWQGDRLVAVGGGAIKNVRWDGSETRSLMLYDFRVDPEFRRGGVGRLLTQTLIEWAKPQAEIGIAFSIGDNRAIQAMALEWFGAATAPAFELLVYPTLARRPTAAIVDAPAEKVRAGYLAAREAPALLCHADEALATTQRIASWTLDDEGAAGCSAWSTAGILEEVVVHLPSALRAASWLLGGSVACQFGLPHVPRLGETLRSWLLFDAHARDEMAMRTLVAGAAARARAAGIDHCHVVFSPNSPWRTALWRDVPKAFAPILPFSIMARTLAGKPLYLRDPAIDPRDI